MVPCRDSRLPGASLSHGAEAAVDGVAGGSPQGLKNWSCPSSLEPTWSRGNTLGVPLKPASGQGLCWEPTAPLGLRLTEVSLPQAPSPEFDLWS